MKRLIYLTNARLPTEKAHGYQICKMCEAFARNGAAITLVHPKRRQTNPELSKKNVFEYYGIQRAFDVKAMTNFDIVRVERYLPGRVFPLFFFMHAFVWGMYAAYAVCSTPAELYYTRDAPLAYWLTRFGLPTVYEAHAVHKGIQGKLVTAAACNPALRLVVALTRSIQERLPREVCASVKTIVGPDGVDLSLFQNLPDRQGCRCRLGLPGDRRIVGYVGRFNTMGMEKGITELIEAAGRIAAQGRERPLVLCVGGPLDAVPLYLDHARSSGLSPADVLFVDRRPNNEVPLWIRACDTVAIPWPWNEFSAYFTSPMKLFEYMASGVPIVASDLPALRDVLQHGRNAWLVTPGQSSALAEGISRILREPMTAATIAKQALQDVKLYTWQQRAENILSALNERQVRC